uniref:Major outer membrane porin n=1 Tax=Chlamydia muridarum TaxID=83560 RepID=MOMPS_CHLMR|nr:RecName: Full=Major outer membrane porin; Short=MOMP; Flags: Precursor [Chlamydia muridarum]pir/I40741/ major outer membrane protein - Chlamydia trachomatis [Chlamydia trachomatis]AAA16615.1 major outer membrane protein [Chlamydia muridarum]
MKKLLKSVLAFAVLGSASSLHALPVGNPAEPSLMIDGILWEGFGGDPCDPCTTWCDAISLRLGYYGDFVFDRVLKTDVNKQFEMGPVPTTTDTDAAADITTSTPRENPAYGKHMQDAEMFTNAAYMALNIWDRFDVFCTLGATSGYLKGNSASFNLVGLFGDGVANAANAIATVAADSLPNVSLSQAVVELYTDTAFAWSVGARAALWECGCATLGASFQYAQSKPKVEELNVLCNAAQFTINKPKGYVGKEFPLALTAGTDSATDTKDASIDYHEWQASLALSYRLNMFTPYIGVKWSRASFDADTIRIAQPKLAEAILDVTTWNPTIAGAGTIADGTGAAATANGLADTLQIVSLQLNKMKSRKSCGLAIGTTIVDADKYAVTVETRLIDERAAHVNAQFRF